MKNKMEHEFEADLSGVEINKNNYDIKCKISLQKEVVNNIFQGMVTLTSVEDLEIRHAYVEISGIGKSSWNLPNTVIRCPSIYLKGTKVDGKVVFYLARTSLCIASDDNEPFLHVQKQSYRFQVFWPARLPGTWYGDHGCIKYMGLVAIKLFNGDLYVHKQDLMVQSSRDLRKEEHLGFESRIDVTKTFTFFNSNKRIVVSVWVPICGIAAGQSLPVLCTIDNFSDFHYGGLVFILTRIDIYKSHNPIHAIQQVRTDICRVARMVNIHKGKYNYYAVMHVDNDVLPTNQFYSCSTCQIVYELWVAVQAVAPAMAKFGFPDIHTPGIPIIIGTQPILDYTANEVTVTVLKNLFTYNPTLVIEEIPEDVKKIIDQTEEELTEEAMIDNLKRQLKEDEKALSKYRELSKIRKINVFL